MPPTAIAAPQEKKDHKKKDKFFSTRVIRVVCKKRPQIV